MIKLLINNSVRTGSVSCSFLYRCVFSLHFRFLLFLFIVEVVVVVKITIVLHEIQDTCDYLIIQTPYDAPSYFKLYHIVAECSACLPRPSPFGSYLTTMKTQKCCIHIFYVVFSCFSWFLLLFALFLVA